MPLSDYEPPIVEVLGKSRQPAHVTFQGKSNRYATYDISSWGLVDIGKAQRIQFHGLFQSAKSVAVELLVQSGHNQALHLGETDSSESTQKSLSKEVTDESPISFYVVPLPGKRGKSREHTLTITVWSFLGVCITHTLILRSAGHKYPSSPRARRLLAAAEPEGLFFEQPEGKLSLTVLPLPVSPNKPQK